jgi:hypothetical protein
MQPARRSSRCLGPAMLLSVGALAVAGCSRGASYPDGPKVAEAQRKWCAALGEIVAGEGKGGSWASRGQCEDVFPSASAEFLARMADCIGKQARIAGAAAFDAERAVDDCTEQVLVLVDVRGASQLELVAARCARMERCQKVAPAECRSGFEGLSPIEQARLTRMYNDGALADVASCLRSSSCAEDEDAAQAACYEDAWKTRAWLPDAD